jgi:eukaryotic-like serine/threonine-protein kinase
VSFSVPGYTVYERLGVGARSTIWLVANRDTGQYFALKRVVRRATDDTRYLVQAQNGYAIAAQLDHPSLRKNYEMRKLRRLFQLKELHIIMEYLDGRTLEEIGALQAHNMLGIFMRVAEGLGAMHQRGFLHADIKPNNIMVTAAGDVKIIDFGQSCPLNHIKGRIQGTPDYIAPEQVQRGIPLTERTDVYNLGATMYWAFTGTRYPTVMQSKKRGRDIDLAGPREAPLPHELNSNIPTALSRLVMDCCNTNPKDRPADMREVLYRLEVAQHVLAKSGMTLTGPIVREPKDGSTVPASPGDTAA